MIVKKYNIIGIVCNNVASHLFAECLAACYQHNITAAQQTIVDLM